MDTGLNNTNTFESEHLKDVEFLVEATSAEKFELWKQYDNKHYNLQDLDKLIPLPDVTSYKVFSFDFMNNLSNECRSEIDKLKQLTQEVEKRNTKIIQSREYKVNWENVSMGIGYTIGTFNGFPVTISFSFAFVNGHKIAFYESNSLVTHYGMVEHFLIKHFQRTNDGYTRWNHTNSTNFHNCIGGLERMDIEPRDTVYKGDSLLTKKYIKENKIKWEF